MSSQKVTNMVSPAATPTVSVEPPSRWPIRAGAKATKKAQIGKGKAAIGTGRPCQRCGMHQRLVIEEFLALGRHVIAVQAEQLAELRRFMHFDQLIRRLFAMQQWPQSIRIGAVLVQVFMAHGRVSARVRATDFAAHQALAVRVFRIKYIDQRIEQASCLVGVAVPESHAARG